jgi:hypothetical protein
MVRRVLCVTDATHFTEFWTKREKGKEVVFALNFTRK